LSQPATCCIRGHQGSSRPDRVLDHGKQRVYTDMPAMPRPRPEAVISKTLPGHVVSPA
jgi:hypothetical protein